MIYDCFIFFNELDLLEIRLSELDGVVDKFVLVEATKTHQGRDKPLYYQEHQARFMRFADKIIHIIVDRYPPRPFRIPMIVEHYQRNMIRRGLAACQPDDVVIISDVDEIPSAEKVRAYQDVPGYKIFQQKLYYYYLNCLNDTDISPHQKYAWYGSVMCDYKDVRYPCHTRWIGLLWMLNRNVSYRILNAGLSVWLKAMLSGREVVEIEDGGWHFSYLGGVDEIIRKLEAFSHSGYNNKKIKDRARIERAMAEGTDLFGRRYNHRFVEIDNSYPQYVLDHLDRFEHLINRPRVSTVAPMNHP